ncbi:MAG TPA: hypothetical protein DER01_12360 [Phycisphaerales bacterium]|nr:hypothetical protein [Phycisphaerales bacterium]|tara:strand:- start:18868 stop:20781 length:1914 start_codon:yes stop_codon:yes gene_type:complete
MKRYDVFSLMFIITLLQGVMASAQTPAPKVIIDAANLQIPARIKTTSDQVTYKHDPSTPLVPGINLTVDPGSDPYPTITFNPDESDHWDFTGYDTLEAQVTNTGQKQLLLCMRLDNPHNWGKSPWSSECLRINAGQSTTIKVKFGRSYGFQPSYPLKPENIIAILFVAGKAEHAQTFRIEKVYVSKGEEKKAQSKPKMLRVKPKDGIILGQGVNIDSTKQIKSTGGVKAVINQSALAIELPSTTGKQEVTLSPAEGFWHLGDATQIALSIRNTGKTPITPNVALSSWGRRFEPRTGKTIMPGQTAEMVVPFAADISWEGVPAAQIKTTHDAKPGTGTPYVSDKTSAITIGFEHTGQASVRIESIIAQTGDPAVIPDWVGKRPPVAGDWVVTFDEEFDAPSVDLSKWRNEGPNHWDKVSRWSKNNIIIKDGKASLHYEKKAGYHNDNPSQPYREYTGAYLDTFTKWSQCYGYFEARMKLPTAHGLWPAFWMMPDRGEAFNLPSGSMSKRCETSNNGMEFDIMEQLGVWGPHRYNVAMHWDNYGPEHKAIGTGGIYVKHDKDGYFTAGLLWLPGKAVFYCNGVEVGRWEDPRISTIPGYMIVYMPSGGWDGNELDDTKLPDDFTIDYVRVWQRKDLMNK